MISNQEIYNKVKAHLLNQMKKAATYLEDGSLDQCLYRGPNDTKCAIGCLIPDDDYYVGLEERPADHPRVLGLLAKQGITGEARFLSLLQYVHDMCEVEKWERELRRVAIDFGLDP